MDNPGLNDSLFLNRARFPIMLASANFTIVIAIDTALIFIFYAYVGYKEGIRNQTKRACSRT
jgi:hypothetical protein